MLNTIITAIVSAVLGWLTRHFAEMLKDYREKKADEGKNQKAREDNEAASTPSERENAAEEIAKKF